MASKSRTLIISIAAMLLLSLPAMADRTSVKAGWNLFTTQQDVEMGRELATELESQMPIVNDSWSNGYIAALGSKLTAHAPGSRFPYQFKIINDDSVNSYALPGGFIYVTSGLIDAAPTEPQLAGLLAHQIAHVVLRHGTQEVSKAYNAEQNTTGVGRVSVATAMNELNIAFEPDSIVFKNSAEAERQADVLATQIMYDARFDPQQMPVFLQTIQNEPTNSTVEFFRNHPAVANRAARVRREVQNMGGLPRNLRGDSPDLRKTQDRLRGEAAASIRDNNNPNNGDVDSRDNLPSSRMVTYRGRDIEFRHPENWRVTEDRDSLTIAPDNGFVSDGLAYGMTIAAFEPQGSSFGQGLNSPDNVNNRTTTLSRATDQLVADLRRSNPNMRVVRNNDQRRVDGQNAMVTELSNDSPLGGRETDWLVTVLRPDGLLHYFIGVAPQREFTQYAPTFDKIVSSVRFND
jgi:Zn-dependent protease with chaperone function